MKICFPVMKDVGFESMVFDHFGTAAFFLVFDTETADLITIENLDKDHMPGSCKPIEALGGHSVDVVIAMGLGAGALIGLSQAGMHIYQAQGQTIKENLDLWENGLFKKTFPAACTGHTDDICH